MNLTDDPNDTFRNGYNKWVGWTRLQGAIGLAIVVGVLAVFAAVCSVAMR